MLSTTAFQSALAADLGVILRELKAMIANCTARNWLIQPIVLLLWNYLGRPAPRLARFIARLAAGPLPPPRPSRAGVARAERPARQRLPSGNAWLIRLIQPTAQFSGQLEALVARPEMADLLAAAPQAGRILRPLFRMLGIRPLPPPLRPAPVAAPAMPRRRANAAPIPAMAAADDPPLPPTPPATRGKNSAT